MGLSRFLHENTVYPSNFYYIRIKTTNLDIWQDGNLSTNQISVELYFQKRQPPLVNYRLYTNLQNHLRMSTKSNFGTLCRIKSLLPTHQTAKFRVLFLDIIGPNQLDLNFGVRRDYISIIFEQY